MSKLTRTQTILLIVFLVTVWGVNWPLSKLALTYTPPVLFSGMRTLLGGLFLFIVAVTRYKQLRFKETWFIYLISALLNVVLYYGLQTIGLNYMPAGLFAAIVFLQPVLVGIFSWLWLGESMYGLKIIGLILGFLGVGVISSGGLSEHISFIGILLALGSSLSWALGTVYVKKIGSAVDSIWLVTLQLIMGGLFMTITGSSVERWKDIVWNWTFILSLLFISVFVIAIGWLVFYKLMDSGEASKVASFTFLIPLLAILIGTLFLNEPFTLSLLVGLVLILVSIYCVNRTRRGTRG
ncbi:putative transporter YvbV [Paenibacillus baekrokdamisoli]|uniref:Putative transporter YvbV n=1 Tax=Paenibacillus baekrokdamisoli TaxID=1712516 RepID=A0A3G9J744_9BACL|nr:DMT family transporter [Paenibacillus baekrokdamisoli]MBB3069986.1 drug/metabolite transporter (DMT)-like permease [Paenibacillus baekrokdamisoli]BBH20663.1 putative transporter YvbV [Paenibacillus baekrokdamisoli]